MYAVRKEFYVVTLSDTDVPFRVAGPFESYEQARVAMLAMLPLYRNQRLSIVGGDLVSMRRRPKRD